VEFADIAILFLFGILGGYLAGLLGVGGGIIFIPLFDFWFRRFGIDNEELVRFILANSFLAIFFSGIFSSIQHSKRGNFDSSKVFIIALPAMITGAILSKTIASHDWYSALLFKMVFISLLGLTLIRSTIKKSFDGDRKRSSKPNYILYVLIGLITGLVSAMSGLGGGVVMIPLLQIFVGKSMKEASAISIGVITFMVLPFLWVYATSSPINSLDWSLGYLQLGGVFPVVCGIFIGSPLGVRSAGKMKNLWLQRIFAGLLLLLIVKYTYELI
jgi:uncharacterized membrane protein YfcA